MDFNALSSCTKSTATGERFVNFLSIFTSVSIVLTNKRILDYFANPFVGSLLVPLHAAVVFCATRGAPSGQRVPIRWLILDALVGLLSLFGSMLVLKYASITFQQIGRLLSLPTSALVDRYFWQYPAMTRDDIVSISGVVIGFILVTLDMFEINIIAIAWNFVAVASQVGSQTVVKVISETYGVDPRGYLTQSAPYSFIFSVVGVFIAWNGSSKFGTVQDELKTLTSGSVPTQIVILLCLSCVLALMVQYLSAWIGQTSSATSYSLLTLTKSTCTIGAGVILFREKLSTRKLLGMSLSLIMFYRYMNSKENRFMQVPIPGKHDSKKSKIMGTTIIILSFVAMVPASELLLNVSENSKAALAVREESTYKFNVFNQSKTVHAHDAKKWRDTYSPVPSAFLESLGSLQKDAPYSPTRLSEFDDGSTLYWADEENHLKEY